MHASLVEHRVAQHRRAIDLQWLALHIGQANFRRAGRIDRSSSPRELLPLSMAIITVLTSLAPDAELAPLAGGHKKMAATDPGAGSVWAGSVSRC